MHYRYFTFKKINKVFMNFEVYFSFVTKKKKKESDTKKSKSKEMFKSKKKH